MGTITREPDREPVEEDEATRQQRLAEDWQADQGSDEHERRQAMAEFCPVDHQAHDQHEWDKPRLIGDAQTVERHWCPGVTKGEAQ